MDKEFSEGFQRDIADLLEYCMENRTDSVALVFNYDETKLKIDIIFSIV